MSTWRYRPRPRDLHYLCLPKPQTCLWGCKSLRRAWNRVKLKGGGYTLLPLLPPFFKIEHPRSTHLKKVENALAQSLTKHRCKWLPCYRNLHKYTCMLYYEVFFTEDGSIPWMWVKSAHTWNMNRTVTGVILDSCRPRQDSLLRVYAKAWAR